MSWQGSKVRKQDIFIAKNYLNEDEIDKLNRLVVIFLETDELRAKSRIQTPITFWQSRVGEIISSNGFPLLTGTGSISHEEMMNSANERYTIYDKHRKQQEVIAIDKAEEEELKALEDKIKKRPDK